VDCLPAKASAKAGGLLIGHEQAAQRFYLEPSSPPKTALQAEKSGKTRKSTEKNKNSPHPAIGPKESPQPI
jgi:hypothetical protein